MVVNMLVLMWMYINTFGWLYKQWSTDKVYSHGFLVPLICVFFLWKKREHLKALSPYPSFLFGTLLLFGSLFLLLIGRIGPFIQLELISLFFIFPAVVLLIWGIQYVKALWMPLFYVQFMLPWMDPFIDKIHKPFQIVAATVGAKILNFKYPVFLDNVYIHLPNINLHVARECSGINFIISVIAIGLPLVYLTQKTWSRASVVLVAGIIITILANSARVALAGYMGQNYGAEMIHGPGHIFRGLFVAQVGWVGVFLVNWLVSRKNHPSHLRLFEKWREGSNLSETSSQPQKVQSHLSKRLLVLLVLLFSSAVYINFFALSNHTAPIKNLPDFPYSFSSWQGKDESWLDRSKYFPGISQEIMRRYQNDEGQYVYLYVGHYDLQGVNHRLVSYHSRPLFSQRQEKVINVREEHQQRVNFSFPVINGTNFKVLSWYRLGGEVLTGSLQVKIKGIQEGLMHRRNNGAVFLLAQANHQGIGDNKPADDLMEFFKEIEPVLDGYFP